MQWTILGTSCMVPTKERNVAGHFLKFKGDGILFDCGEGTQRQMNICGLKRTDVTKVCITHWHGDHCSGLIGLIQTIGDEEHPPTIEIIGPKSTKERIFHMLKSCSFTQNVKLKIHEVEPNGVETVIDEEEYLIQAASLKHSVPCLGYAFVEKDRKNIDVDKLNKLGIRAGPHLAHLKEGKEIIWQGKKVKPEELVIVTPGIKIAYITDTRPVQTAVDLAFQADVLVSEAVYTSNLQENAEHFKHMTAREAGQLASLAGVKKLVLSHFSQRFKNTQALEEEARTVFNNVVCANDFMRMNF